jgi:hypothetical protein
MKSANDPNLWFLIDFDDASTAPTRAAKHLDRGNHSPRVFEDGHCGEVDLWGVGHLIMESANEVSADEVSADEVSADEVSADMLAIGKNLLDYQLTAEGAIKLIERYVTTFFILLADFDCFLVSVISCDGIIFG